MGITDLLDFGLYAALLTITLLAVFYTLKYLGWNGKNRLFLDAFFIWLTWIFSSITAFFVLMILDVNTAISSKMSFLVFVIFAVLFIYGGGVIGTAIVMWRLVKEDDNDLFIFEVSKTPWEKPGIFRMSFITTLAATWTLILVVAMGNAGRSTYYYFYPPPKLPFEIYDI
jgi:hypothetical protein